MTGKWPVSVLVNNMLVLYSGGEDVSISARAGSTDSGGFALKHSLRTTPSLVPSHVQTVVSERQLGAIKKLYSIHKIKTFFLSFFQLLFGMVLALMSVILIISLPAYPNNLVVAIFVFLIFGPIGVIIIWNSLHILGLAVTLHGKMLYRCSKGLVLAGRKQAEVFPYEEMDLRFRAVAIYRFGVFHEQDKYNVEIRRREDKKKIELDESNLGTGVAGLATFKAELVHEIVQAQLPGIQSMLKAGETIWFKIGLGIRKLGINNNEIIHKRREKEKQAAWSELTSASVQNGFLDLHIGGGKWLTLIISSIENYDLMKLLIDQKLEEYGGVERDVAL